MRLKSSFNKLLLSGALLLAFSSASWTQALQAQPPGKSVYLDGNDDYVLIDNSAGVNSPAITIEAWIKPCSTGIMAIVSKRDDNLIFDNYTFMVINGRLRFTFRQNGSQASALNYVESDQQIIQTGVWQHVAVVHNTADSRSYLFYNGVKLDPATECNYFGSFYPLGSGGGNIRIGVHPTGSNNYNWYGNMDEVVIWNYARPDSLIDDDMTGITPFPISTGVEVYLDMEVDAIGQNDILPNNGNSTVDDGTMKNWNNPTVTTSPFTVLNGVNVCCVSETPGARIAPAPSVDLQPVGRLEIAPNPNQGTFKLNWPEEAGATAYGEINDLVTGKTILRGEFSRGQEVTLPSSPTGTLSISILTESGLQLNGKMISQLK